MNDIHRNLFEFETGASYYDSDVYLNDRSIMIMDENGKWVKSEPIGW